MAEFAIMAAMAGGGAMETIGNIKAGRESKRQAYEQASQATVRAGQVERQGFERLYELEREKGAAVGRVKGAAAKSGLRSGGSVKTLMDKISADYERRSAYIGSEYAAQTGALLTQAHDLRRAGRRAKQAGYWGAGGSLLSTGSQIGKFGYETGMWGK